MKTIKATSNSKSGKTFYFTVKVPAGVLETSEGMFCGCSDKAEASIEDINWTFCFGRNFRRYVNITTNGKHQLKDYVGIINQYAN